MTIFVTGASGFVGQAFLNELLSQEGRAQTVYVLTRSPLPEALIKNKAVKVLQGELSGLANFTKEIQQSDYVFHIAANPSFSAGSLETEADNLVPVQALLRILKASTRLKSLIFVSSIGAADRAKGDLCHGPLTFRSVANPRSAYGQSKLSAENAIRASGLPFTILRPGWIYGPNMRANSHLNQFVTMISRGSRVANFNFPGVVSLIHVRDMAKALTRCLGNDSVKGKTFFAVTEAQPLGQILATIGQKVQGERPFQIPVIGGAWLIRRVHHKLPIAINNLFVGYLWAEEGPFINEFGLTNFIPFWAGVDDIVSTNSRTGGRFLITGANSGIGLALAKKLNKVGRKMILVDKKIDALGEFKNHEVFSIDLSQPKAIDEVAVRVQNQRLAALVNNAGVGFRKNLDEISPAEVQLTLQVNDLAPVLLTKSLLRQLKRDSTTIINVGSSTAYNPLPGMSIYAASKAFLVNWSEALSYELRATNVVITLSPSGTRTGFQKAAGVAVLNEGKGLQSAESVADAIFSAFVADRRFIVLGFPSKVLLFVSRFLPRSLNVQMWGILFAKMR